MTDRIKELEEQAKVILEWCRQQRLPEEERDILEFRRRQLNSSQEWTRAVTVQPTNLNLYDWRLSKRPKTRTATVYWWRYSNGNIAPSLKRVEWPDVKLIGTSTVEFTEPQE